IASVQPLSSLTSLVTLKLSGNLIEDLSPLSNLTNLQTLHLEFNRISDLSALSSLTSLTTLTLSGNMIDDLTPLIELTGLVNLHLDGNLISNLSALIGLTNLDILYLDWNQIGEIGALVSNSGLASGDLVTLEMNPLNASTVCSDISTLTTFPRFVSVTHGVTDCSGTVDVFPDPALEAAVKATLIGLGHDPGAAIEPGDLAGKEFTSLIADSVGIRNISGLQYATELQSIILTNNLINDISPLSGLSNLTSLNLSGNRITIPAPLAGMTGLTTVELDDNLIGDVSTLGEIPGLSLLSLRNNILHDISPLGQNDTGCGTCAPTALATLRLDGNQIIDISPVATMLALNELTLADNSIGDIDGIMMNAGIANGDSVDLTGNPLNAMAICESIGVLESLGITVLHDGTACSEFIDRHEPDAYSSQAILIEPGQLVTDLSLVDILPNTDDKDWVKFELLQTAEVSIESVAGTLEPADAEISTELYDTAGLSPPSPLAVSSETIVMQLSPGTYYVSSEEANGLFISDYAVRVSVDYYEPNGGDDISANATPITIGQPSEEHTLTGGEIVSGVVASFDMETDPEWTTDSGWAYGTPAGGGAVSHGNPDPTSGVTGSNVYGVNLDGDYSTSVGGPFYLTTGAIDCSDATGVTLAYYRWLNTDYEPYVYETVDVSSDGTNWTSVWGNATPSIQDSSWALQTFDISSVADGMRTVFVRWGHQVGNQSAFAYSGWNIDDVQITGDLARPSDDVDWFEFTVGSPEYLQMRTNTFFGDTKIEFFGPDDSTLPIAPNYSSDDNTMYFTPIASGQYFARVTEFPTGKGFDYRSEIPSYTLTVEDQSTPDRYEDDDAFDRATVLELDPVIAGGRRAQKQTHNFHDAGDEDWCVMVVPRAEFHPSIELTDLGPRANPIIDVYAADATTLLATGYGTMQIDFNTVDDEVFFIRIRNADPNVFGVDTAYGASGSGGNEIVGSVTGTIRDEDGNPIQGIRLTIPATPGRNYDINSSVSGADGFFFMGDVPLGTHTARYQASCGLELEVIIKIQSSNEHNVNVNMAGCPISDPIDVFVNLDIAENPDENGTSPRPFSSVTPGVVAVTPGGTIHLRGVQSSEVFKGTFKLGKPMTLLAENIDGQTPVLIGVP
ncbi:MAG: leucine-rich repeat domain-containing protein, partial [Candidatus Hydrogenedentota bacterium]